VSVSLPVSRSLFCRAPNHEPHVNSRSFPRSCNCSCAGRNGGGTIDPAGSTCARRNPLANCNPKSFAGVVVVVVVALRMTSLQIPEHVVLNETVRMQCNFNLDKELLYSVKWYKDGHEFYRYTPRDAPTVLTFPVAGVNVNVSASLRGLGMLRIARGMESRPSPFANGNSQSSAMYPLTERNIPIYINWDIRDTYN